jgi:hypothetical protein
VELIKSREASGELLALEKDSALRVYWGRKGEKSYKK